ncbi:MAG: hypothetical protein GVY15_05290 [Bacteroidetes bacterium]|nr:hypothetical protein [Bacteroidota bacterium]
MVSASDGEPDAEGQPRVRGRLGGPAFSEWLVDYTFATGVVFFRPNAAAVL